MSGYHHRHSDWILYGIGLAIGFLLFKMFVLLIAFVCAAVWAGTANWETCWRRTTRTSFVIALTVIVVPLAAMIFAE